MGQVRCTGLPDSRTFRHRGNGSSLVVSIQVGGARSAMKTKDKYRKWMWIALGVLSSLQLYFVRELLAALALFMLVFGLIGGLIASLYMLQKTWEAGLGIVLASPAVPQRRLLTDQTILFHSSFSLCFVRSKFALSICS